jgi:hypothetical protein
MLGTAMYYVILSAACLSMIVYNMNYATVGRSLQCYSIKEMSYGDFQNYIQSLGNKSSTILKAKDLLNLKDAIYAQTNNSRILFLDANDKIDANQEKRFLDASPYNSNNVYNIYQVPVESVNSLSSLQEGVGILYLIILIFSTLMACFVNYLMNLIPDDFLRLSKISQLFGGLCKLFPLAINILHLVIIILLIVEWGFIGGKNCEYSIPISFQNNGFFNNNTSRYYSDSKTLSTVSTVFWVLLHYVGACIRHMSYVEPFMYTREVENENICSKILLKMLGP